jgi:glycosyltransferase involved in cell wall biosynthesis
LPIAEYGYTNPVQFVIHLLGGLLAAAWGGLAADVVSGARNGRSLKQQEPYREAGEAPALSVVIAACNEEEKLPAAFRSLLAQEYPGPFEIVAVDDRSTDATPALLDGLAGDAGADKRVVALHLRELPPGWLGKTHALYQGAKRATGRWLLFTDADIVFAPDALSRAVRLAEEAEADHLAIFMDLDLRGFWETVFGLSFGFLFSLRFRPWRVRDRKSSAYLGIGGFNMVRRAAYEKIGTHRAIALEVADDMELGRRVKVGGFQSEVASADGLLSVRWQEGFDGLVRGLDKNAYAGMEYSPLKVLSGTFQLLFGVLWPFLGLLFARGRGRTGYALAAGTITALAAAYARRSNVHPAYALTIPLAPLLMILVMFRSMIISERNGGITWRGTFYSLETLREKAIPAE